MPPVPCPLLKPLIFSIACMTLLAASSGVAAPATRRNAALVMFAGLALWWILQRLRREQSLVVFGLLGIATLMAPLSANAHAGALVVFVPVAAALALRRPLGLSSIVAAASGLMVLWVIVKTDSRGGLAALLVALVVGMVAASARPRRTSTMILVAMSAVAATGLAIAGQADSLGFAQRILLENNAEGLSLTEVLTGRPTIWRRSLWMIADSPSVGLGLGGFAPSLACCYPGAPDVEHAHQMLLQASHDFGLPGMLIVLLLVATSIHKLLELRRHDREWAAALLAAFAAHLSFGVVDSVALWTPGSLGFWALLGLVWQPSPARAGRRLLMPIITFRGMLLVTLVWALAARWMPAEVAAPRALAAITSGATHEERQSAADALANASIQRPWLLWLGGRAHPDVDQQNRLWLELIDTSPQRLPLLATVGEASPRVISEARHGELAAAALTRWPLHAEAWRWQIAQKSGPQIPQKTTQAHVRGVLGLQPDDGQTWLELGNRLLPEDREGALFTWTRACVHGDPGANGCWRAGQLAESLGDQDAAKRLYRRSRWARARLRVDNLHPADSGAETP